MVMSRLSRSPHESCVKVRSTCVGLKPFPLMRTAASVKPPSPNPWPEFMILADVFLSKKKREKAVDSSPVIGGSTIKSGGFT